MASSTLLVLITGASDGIGRATAVALGKQRHTVILVARRADKLAAVADEVRAAGGVAHVSAVDGGDGAAVVAAARAITADVGVPDVIVHCAGAGEWRFVEDTPPAELAKLMTAPFLSAFHFTHAFMAPMLARKSGSFVFVQSPVSRMPWSGCTGYASARWAMRGLHEALVQDLRGTGLHACEVVFGEVSSSYFDVNVGAKERLPTIGKLVPVMSPAQCAEVLVDVVHSPRRETIAPLMLRFFSFFTQHMPRTIRFLVAITSTAKRST